MDEYCNRGFSFILLKEVIITPPCASLLMHLAAMVSASPLEDGFLGRDKGSLFKKKAVRVSTLCQPPALAVALPCFSLPVLSAVSRKKRLFNWQLSKLYSLIAQLQPGNAPAQQQLCHCLTSLQPRPIDIVSAHFCCSHGCQGKLGRANPCHYSCRKQITW